MEELNSAVLRGFGLKAKKIVREKAFYICNTNVGYRVIKKSFDDCQSILFQHQLKEHLYAKGFWNTDRFFLSVNNDPYFIFSDDIYVCTELFDYREVNFSDHTEFLHIVEEVARFHSLARELTFDRPIVSNYPKEEYSKAFNELQSIKRSINSQKRLSDFDVHFLKNYNYYLDKVKISMELFKNPVFMELLESSLQAGTVSHGRLKEENILIDNEIYLTKFSDARIGEQMMDLCSLIQRHVKYSDQPVPLDRVLEAYSRFISINESRRELLVYLLIYPEKYVSICRQFYSKKRTWTPSALATRIEDIINSRDKFEAYLKSEKV